MEIISYRLVFIVQVATPEVSRFGEVESREDQVENRLSWEVILGVEKNYFIEFWAFSFPLQFTLISWWNSDSSKRTIRIVMILDGRHRQFISLLGHSSLQPAGNVTSFAFDLNGKSENPTVAFICLALWRWFSSCPIVVGRVQSGSKKLQQTKKKTMQIDCGSYIGSRRRWRRSSPRLVFYSRQRLDVN